MSESQPVNISLSAGKIDAVGTIAMADKLTLTFQNALIFPGLINSHDHLDFNLFPALGNHIYQNYTDWGKFIHENYKDQIADVLKVPIVLREEWGIIKNLLCGVTTVVNHGNKLQGNHTLINVHAQYQCIHSVGFEKRWKRKLNTPLKTKLPVVLHVGEGNNMAAYREINELLKWNLLRKTLVGVHAVAMTEEQASKFKAIVWCPQSNYFLLNRTAHINRLKLKTTVLFGTDSTLTGNWNIWDHLRQARSVKMMSDDELYKTLNINAVKTWQTGTSEIKPGARADLVLVKNQPGQSHTETFFATNPQDILMVIQSGNIRLFDESLYPQLAHTDLSGYSRVRLNDSIKYIQADVPALMKKIKQYYPAFVFPISALT